VCSSDLYKSKAYLCFAAVLIEKWAFLKWF
jgi:hypothetical protein